MILIGSQKDISSAIHMKIIVTLKGQFLQQVNATVHEAHHRSVWAGPPVAVSFRGLVTGERERRTLIHQ